MEATVPPAGLRLVFTVGALALLFAWETWRPFRALFGTVGGRVRHGGFNLAIGSLNAVAIAIGFAALWAGATEWAAQRDFGVLNWIAPPPAVRLGLAVLLLDAWTYAWHWLNHRVPWFWRFHRLHHADRAMDVTTASRFHLGEIAISSLLRVPILVVFGCRLEELALYEIALFTVVQFHHANLALPPRLERLLGAVLVTPGIHHVHHSIIRAECDSNYASLFSWWDRLFGTRRTVADPRRIVFGVEK